MMTATFSIFACALVAWTLNLSHVISATNLTPHILTGAAMIVALLRIVERSDRRD